MIRINLAASVSLPQRRSRIVFLLIVLLSTLEGHAIIDGIPVPDGEYPAVFGFKAITHGGNTGTAFGKSNEQTCTGFLVHPSLILTAAHCVKGRDSIQFLTNGEKLSRKNMPNVQKPRIQKF